MVHTTVRPVLTVLRTVRMTMAAARASSPANATCSVLCDNAQSQDHQACGVLNSSLSGAIRQRGGRKVMALKHHTRQLNHFHCTKAAGGMQIFGMSEHLWHRSHQWWARP